MRKQFDIKYRSQIESGEYKVETRDGRIAKIIYWEAHHCKPIIILITSDFDSGTEIPLQLYKNGKFYPKGDSNFDLFIITPEEEMTEFEQEVSDIVEYCKIHGKNVVKDYVKRHAKTLLDIAEKELSTKYRFSSDLNGFAYGKGYEDGMKEALKDLPRWGDIRNFQYAWKSQEETFYDRDLGQLFHKGKKLFISDLEKLPGFKED